MQYEYWLLLFSGCSSCVEIVTDVRLESVFLRAWTRTPLRKHAGDGTAFLTGWSRMFAHVTFIFFLLHQSAWYLPERFIRQSHLAVNEDVVGNKHTSSGWSAPIASAVQI